jgi:hypothetical protein
MSETRKTFMNQIAAVPSHKTLNASDLERTRPKSTIIAFVVLFAIGLSPVLWYAIPAAMVDYPNHLARMFVLSRDGSAQAHPFYQVTWAFYPDLAMDLLVPRLGHLIGVEPATRLFYLAGQILIVTGAAAIERVVKGRVAIAGFVALMFLYSLPFAWGFVNFEFALGCALWGIAGALAVQERGWMVRLALHGAVIAWLFVAHMFALGIYGYTIGVHELWRARTKGTTLSELVGRLAVMAVPTLALAIVMFASGGAVGGSGTYWFLIYKPIWALLIMSGYSPLASTLGVVALIALTRELGQRGALRFEQSGIWLAAGFVVLYVAIPETLFDTSFVDLRVIVAAALIVPAFVSVSFPSAAWSRMALAVSSAITIVNVAVVLGVWLSYREDYAAARESFRLLPKRAMVLIGHSGKADDPPMSHLNDYPLYNVPTLAVNYADAFVPNLFTGTGKQPVTPRTPWQRLAIPYGGPVPLALLKTIAEQIPPSETPPYIRTWPQDFDYLYLLGPAIPNPMPALLEQVSTAPDFVLYRIRKSHISDGAPR